MSLDVERRNTATPAATSGHRPKTRDIERYAALFADRTKVMRSSAMRDLMALTERDDVISLAGGLPDTSTFPPDSYASLMNSVSVQSCARALQYGPTDGLGLVKSCIAEVMAAEGMSIDSDEVLVTTGGQQAIDLVCKTLVDPGDVIVAEAPTYPGAIPTFCSYQADVVQISIDRDGMRTDELEATLDAARARGPTPEVHLHGAELPQPGRRDDVAASGAASWSRSRPSGSCSCSRTTRTGCSATRASRCRRCTRSTTSS